MGITSKISSPASALISNVKTSAWCEEEYQCSHVFAADYSPTSNVVERVHQQLSRVLRIFVHKCGRAWSSCLDEAAFAYNSTDLSMAPYSPHFLVHLRHPRVIPDIRTQVPTDKKELQRRLRKAMDPDEYVASRKPLADEVYASLLAARREVEERQPGEEEKRSSPKEGSSR